MIGPNRPTFHWPETLQGGVGAVTVPLADADGVHRADLLLSQEQARALAMMIGPLCADYGPCRHPLAVSVTAIEGGTVAALCPDCDLQLPAEWRTTS